MKRTRRTDADVCLRAAKDLCELISVRPGPASTGDFVPVYVLLNHAVELLAGDDDELEEPAAPASIETRDG